MSAIDRGHVVLARRQDDGHADGADGSANELRRGLGTRFEDDGVVNRDGNAVFRIAVPKKPLEIGVLRAKR